MPFLALYSDIISKFTQSKKLSPLTTLVIQNQTFLFFPLMSFARISWALQSWFWVNIKSIWWGQEEEKVEIMNRLLERILLVVHWCWYAAIVWMAGGNWWVFVGVSQGVAGVFLASVFSLNHVS